jgi:methionine-gamma-lyase
MEIMTMLRRLRRDTKFGFATRAIHVGYDPADAQGALTPPVHLTSTYAFELAEHGAEVFAGIREGYAYGRTKNPTQTILEERIADLEGAEAALAVGSGMGAISALMWTLLAEAVTSSSTECFTAIVMRSLPGD